MGLEAALDMAAVRRRGGWVDDMNSRGGDNIPRTCLMVAAAEGHEGVVEVLLRQPGLRVNDVDDGGVTALHLACGGGHQGVVRRLLEHRCRCASWQCGGRAFVDVAARTADGHTALMTAVCSGQVACVRLLVQVEGIDLYTMDGEGATLDMVPTKHPHSSLPEEVRQTMLQGSPKALRIVQLARERKLLQEEKRRLEEYKVLQQQNRKDLKRLEKVVEERKKNEVEKGMEEGINKIETVGGTGKNAKNKE